MKFESVCMCIYMSVNEIDIYILPSEIILSSHNYCGHIKRI